MFPAKPLLVVGLAGILAIAQAQSDTKSTGKDRMLAGWLLQDNEKEVALSQIGAEKAKSPDVKEFARQMITDHKAMIAKLQPVAGNAGAGVASRESEGTPRPSSAKSDEGDFLAIKKDLTQQCIQSAKRELEKASGAEFDKKFMMLQLVAHMEAVDTLTTFQKHASPELRGMLAESLKKVEEHLEHAKRICEKVEGQRS